MKRPLTTLLFLATLGMAVAGPPVDVQLVCGESEDAPLVGVAMLVEDELHVSLIDGALDACLDGVFGVAGGETLFRVTTYTVLDGAVTDVQVAFDADPEYAPTLTYEEVPAVAVDGMLGAQENRARALELATRARERAPEHAGGPPLDVPADGGDEEEAEEEELEDDGEEGDGPPADLPAPASPGRR